MVSVVILLLRIETFTVTSHVFFTRPFPAFSPFFFKLKILSLCGGEYMSVRIPDNKGRIINEGLFKDKYLIKLSQYFGNLAKAVMR